MYFTLAQAQYLGLALFGGLLLIAILIIGFWSYKLYLAGRREEEKSEATEEHLEEFPDGLQEGHKPIPLLIVILIPALIIWGIGYTLAHMFGVFYAQ